MKLLYYKQKMTFNKLLFMLIILLISNNLLTAQSFETTSTNFIPPSPNAASLANFTEASVDHKSGVMNLAIPLVNVQSKSLITGLQGSYSAKGIKVKEDASTIGLGWSLTGYGVITRTVIGRPDETPNRGYFHNDFNINMKNDELFNVYTENWDLEPDLYSYNFAGYSGKFVMDKDQNIVHLEKTDLKFIPKSNQKGWDVIEPNGTKHQFYQTEQSGKLVENSNSTYIATTAWYQTKSQTYDNSDFINYIYEVGNNYTSPEHITNTRFVSNSQNTCIYNGGGCSRFGGASTIADVFAESTYLKQIQTVFHNVQLEYSDRLDIIGGKKLDNIQLKNKTTNEVLKTYNFSYSYFAPSNQKLKLDTIQEVGKFNETIPPFVFTYNSTILNDKNGHKMDHWGFQNIRGNLNTPGLTSLAFIDETNFDNPDREPDNESLTGLLSRIDYPTGWYESFNYELNDVGYFKILSNTVNDGIIKTKTVDSKQENITTEVSFKIEENFPNVQIQLFLTGDCQFEGDCIISFTINDESGNAYYSGGENGEQIEVISLPLGIYTASITNSEPNIDARLVVKFFHEDPNQITKKTVGGARIQSITNPDGTKTFSYFLKDGNLDRSSGILIDVPKYKRYKTEHKACVSSSPLFSDLACGFACPGFLSSSSSVANSFSNDVLIYTEVQETFPDGSSIEYVFDYAGNTYPPTNTVQLPIISREHIRGDLIEKRFVTIKNKLVRKETYNYTAEVLTGVDGGIVELINQQCTQLDADLYNHISYWKKLDEVIVEDIDLEDITKSVNKSTQYFYENHEHLQPTKQRTTNSNNKIYETRYKYYDEYADNDATTNDNNIKTWLQTNNIMEPWETSTYVYDNATDTSPTQTDGTRFEYNNFGTSVYYPKKFDRYEVTWDKNGALDDEDGWQPQYTINSYDTGVGKPTSITVDGWIDPTTYTWTSTGKLNTKTYKDFVTDYNYHPNTDLLSEIIEPDEQKTTFTYDNFMRLDVVESRGGKIKKDYNYSYHPNFIEEITTFNDTSIVNNITNTTKTTFDGLGRDIRIDQVGYKWKNKVSDPDTDITIIKEYNNRGLLWKVYEPDVDLTDKNIPFVPANIFTEYTYHPDPLGRVKTIKDPMCFTTSSTYGTNSGILNGFAAGTLMRETMEDPDGISTSTYTDLLGRAVATKTFTDTEESITYTNYDDKNRVSSIIPPGATINDAGLIYQYTYDGADNVLNTKFPYKGLMEYSYDARNLQTAMRDANIKAKGWLNTEYDAYGRLDKQGFGTTIGIVTDLLIQNYYDNNDAINTVNATTPIYKGKLHKSKVNILNGFNKGNNYLTTSYTLDDYGRVSKESLTSHIGLTESVEYSYDMADNLCLRPQGQITKK